MAVMPRSLNPALADLDAMNFLNEVTLRFPDAVSFAPGRPFERLFDVAASLDSLRSFVSHYSDKPFDQALNSIAQYGRTKGIICDLVREMLRRDEQIDVSADSILITVGNQEATFAALATLFGRRSVRDVLLVADPSYVGVSGAARILGIDIWPVSMGSEGLDLEQLDLICRRAASEGRIVRALYLIPDFSNPQGTTMPLAAREALLKVAAAHDFLVLEDNVYGMFNFDGPRLPTLKALDRAQHVIYLGSFSKLLYPGLRVGFVVADQALGQGTLLADEIAKVKSMTTVNTSPLTQAIVGGWLIDHRFTLCAATAEKNQHYKRNRDVLLHSLEHAFRESDNVSWNRPRGGFFLTLDVPVSADESLLMESAENDGVLWVPMRYFYLRQGGEQQIRLSFSGITDQEIGVGVDRLATLVRRASKSVGERRR